MFGSSSPFGQSASAPFGSQSPFGQNNVTNNPFAPKPFGATNSFGSQTGGSLFGNTSTGVFGQSSQLSSTPGFGASSSGFGSSTPAFGNQSSPFGGSSAQKPFGAFGSGTQTSPFGSSNQQSQSTFGSSLFTSTPAFGAQSQSAFGGTSTPAFGSSSTSAFGPTGTAAFGATSAPAFGSTPSTSFGNTGSAFGAGSAPAFGSAGAFGSSNPSTFGGGGAPGFGATSNSAFVATSTPAFGTGSTPAFGQSSPSTFGAATTPSFSFNPNPAIGQATPSFVNTGFGVAPSPFGTQGSSGAQTTTPSFGSGTFGQSNLVGSRVTPYLATADTDGTSQGKLESISAMQAYKDKSHEELRWEDYQRGDKGGPNAGNQSTTFAMPGTLGQSNQSPFQSSTQSTFGQPNPNPFQPSTQSTQTNLFPSASKPSPFVTSFGATTPSFSSTFASAPSTTPSLFSTPVQTTFGTTSTAFTSSPSIFGGASLPATGGSSIFGPTSTSTFGSQPNMFQSSSPSLGIGSSLGQTSSPFGQSSSLFPPTSSPFGQTPSFASAYNTTPNSFSTSGFPSSSFATGGQMGFSQSTPTLATSFQQSPLQTGGLFNFNPGQTQTGGVPGNLGQTFGQSVSGNQSSAILQPVAITNPFGTLPAMPHMSIGNTGTSPSIQYGISSMPVVDKPTPVRVSSPLTSRHLSQRRIRLPARKYHPKNDGSRVAFFSEEDEAPSTPKADALFIPRENPRALIIRPMDQWPKSSIKEASVLLCENGTSVENQHHLNGSVAEGNNIMANGNGLIKEQSYSVKISQKATGSSDDTPNQKGDSYITLSGHRAGEAAIVYEHGADIEATMPKLRHSDYYTEPRVQELAAKERAEPGFCRHVKDFVVGRHGYGSIKFLGETDVRRLDLESVIQFNNREVIVYMDDSKKPPVGQGLNKPAEVTLLNIKAVDKKTGNQVLDGPKIEKYKAMLRKKAEDQGAEFLSYDPSKAEWKFRVDHFSKYALCDDDQWHTD